MEDKSMKGTLQALAIKQALHYIEHEPIKNLPKLLHWVDTFDKEDRFLSQRTLFHHILDHPEGNWYQLILRFFQLEKGVRKAFLENFIIHATLSGSPKQEQVRQREGCNVPWAILLDPTSACNLHCTGCWAAEYGPRMRLDLGTMDSIIRQGKALGTHMYIYTGGEPLMRKADLMTLCRRHPDCEFLAFTNGTLIDEAFCQEMLQVKNFVPAISLEGFSAANDSRRGQGVFDRVQQAMKLLRSHRLPFGISTCYTSQNCDDISSDLFFDRILQAGALFAWFFHYICPWAPGRCPLCCPPRPSGKWSMSASATSARPSPSLPWTFRTTQSLWAGASPGGGSICTSTPPGMWSPACSFTTPM